MMQDDGGTATDAPQPPRWLTAATVRVSLVVFGVVASLWVVAQLRGLLVMVFVALFISVALEPAVQWLVRRGWRRGAATALVFTVALVLVIGFLAALVPVVLTQADAIAESVPEYVDTIEAWLESQDLVDVGFLGDQILAGIQDLGGLASAVGSRLAGGLLAVGNTVVGGIFSFVTIALFAFYMVADGPRMRSTVLSFLEPHRQREVTRAWEIAVEKTGGYIYSRLVLSIVAAIFSGVVFAALGLPYVVGLAIWVGVISQFVPIVGAYIGALLPMVVALSSEPIDALWVLVALTVYQQVENYFVAPRITARSMAIHPAVSLGAVIAGASLLGGLGAVLALPVAATIQAFASTAMARHDVIDPPAEAANHRPRGPALDVDDDEVASTREDEPPE